MHLHGTITPGHAERRLPRRDQPGPRLQRHADLRQHRHRHDRLRPDVARRPDARLRLARDDLHGAQRRGLHERRAAPTGDSEDFFFVNQLQTMNVAAGHTLTLDGQDGTDTYVVNTTGSQACLGNDQIAGATCHNYVINVLDTGRAGQRLRRADRQRRRQRAQRLPGRRQDAVPDRRHLPAPPLEVHRLDADARPSRTRSPTTRPSSRSCTGTSAPRRRSPR